MKKFSFILLMIALLSCMVGCNTNEPDNINPITKKCLKGKIQKGPFIAGTSIHIYSLGENFAQTGIAFKTSIVDKMGTFEQRDMQLSSQFVELEATGYYFNEVKNELSSSPLTLSALADITTSDNVNVNILTTLERERILYLISRGSNFHNAQTQAHREVLAVFGMTPTGIDDAVNLELENDPQLLVISALVQGLRSTAEVTQLIANIASDLREDGILDNPSTGSILKNNSMGIRADQLVANMAGYDMTYSYSVIDVQKLLNQFNTNTSYQLSEYVTYPAESDYGRNILAGGTFRAGETYSFAALTPDWCPLKVEVRGVGEWAFELLPNAPRNWKADTFSSAGEYNRQMFTVIKPGEESVLRFYVEPQIGFDTQSDDAPAENTMVLVFYENSDTPTREMTIQIE